MAARMSERNANLTTGRRRSGTPLPLFFISVDSKGGYARDGWALFGWKNEHARAPRRRLNHENQIQGEFQGVEAYYFTELIYKSSNSLVNGNLSGTLACLNIHLLVY